MHIKLKVFNLKKRLFLQNKGFWGENKGGMSYKRLLKVLMVLKAGVAGLNIGLGM